MPLEVLDGTIIQVCNDHMFFWRKEQFAKIKNDQEAYFLEQIEVMQQEPVDKRSEQYLINLKIQEIENQLSRAS